MLGDQERGVIARNILALRAFREDDFPRALFDEYAWDMLLLLFVGLSNNEIISESSLIKQADATPGAGRRWIAHLVDDGHVVARSDGDDVILTQSAVKALRTFLDRVSALPWSGELLQSKFPQVPGASGA